MQAANAPFRLPYLPAHHLAPDPQVHPIMRLLAGHAHADRHAAYTNEALVAHLIRTRTLQSCAHLLSVVCMSCRVRRCFCRPCAVISATYIISSPNHLLILLCTSIFYLVATDSWPAACLHACYRLIACITSCDTLVSFLRAGRGQPQHACQAAANALCCDEPQMFDLQAGPA